MKVVENNTDMKYVRLADFKAFNVSPEHALEKKLVTSIMILLVNIYH